MKFVVQVVSVGLGKIDGQDEPQIALLRRPVHRFTAPDLRRVSIHLDWRRWRRTLRAPAIQFRVLFFWREEIFGVNPRCRLFSIF